MHHTHHSFSQQSNKKTYKPAANANYSAKRLHQVKKMKIILLVAALIALAHARPETKAESQLLRKLRQGPGTANIMVTFNRDTRELLKIIQDTRFDTRGDLLWAIHDNLKFLSTQTHVGVLPILEGNFVYKSLWITNQIFVKDATLDLVLDLLDRDEVVEVAEEVEILLDYTVESDVMHGRQNPEGEWGIRKIQAKEAWEFLNRSTDAAPVRISTIDTGCRFTHEALRDNWVGPEYGWYDPYDKNPLPMDLNGHGTHTTGTIAGSHGIGVYPQAKWTACRGCATASCMQSALLECAQFCVCPTNPDGSNPRCQEAPHLVSNSWGGGRGATWFDGAIAAFHTAKIIPLFSIGNSGPSCNTANSPGDRHVIGVGSTTEEDSLSSFSSVGPTIDGKMKPDVSAPGSAVISAYNSADDAYRSLSGTSMACPHAAGLTSLLLAYNPNLEFDEVITHMTGGVEREPLVSAGRNCEGVPDTGTFPNYHFGQGRINALRSLRNLHETMKAK